MAPSLNEALPSNMWNIKYRYNIRYTLQRNIIYIAAGQAAGQVATKCCSTQPVFTTVLFLFFCRNKWQPIKQKKIDDGSLLIYLLNDP